MIVSFSVAPNSGVARVSIPEIEARYGIKVIQAHKESEKIIIEAEGEIGNILRLYNAARGDHGKI